MNGSVEYRRPKAQDDKRAEAFLEVIGYLEENDDEQITINDLIDLKKPKLADIKFIVTCTWRSFKNTLIRKLRSMTTFRTTADNGIHYVLDGDRVLLQRIPWSCRSDICHQYTEYVARKHRNAIMTIII